MSQSIPELRRALPDFERWLDQRGHSGRAPGFEELADLAVRTQDEPPEHLDEDSRSFLRLWSGLLIAVVELCSIEQVHGREPHDIVKIMPRALACAAFYASASIFRDDTPWRTIAKILIEEFRFGAKEAADQHAERLAREEGGRS